MMSVARCSRALNPQVSSRRTCRHGASGLIDWLRPALRDALSRLWLRSNDSRSSCRKAVKTATGINVFHDSQQLTATRIWQLDLRRDHSVRSKVEAFSEHPRLIAHGNSPWRDTIPSLDEFQHLSCGELLMCRQGHTSWIASQVLPPPQPPRLPHQGALQEG